MNARTRIRIRGFADAVAKMRQRGLSTLADFFVEYEAANLEMSTSEVRMAMRERLKAMRDSVAKGKEDANVTPSGLIAGGADKMGRFISEGRSLLAPGFSELVQNLLAVGEYNACMGRIVAAPTAGAAGAIPGAFLSVAERHEVPEDRIIDGLFIAGGVGEVIALNASLSGSVHGCQAEHGSASAMAAAGIVSLFTTDPAAIESGAAFALKNLLGLACDPVGGLVEIPCVKRNVVAGLNAVASAEMALAGIRTVIPFDEVVAAMAEIGTSLPISLKETSRGGLAATPTGKCVLRKLAPDHSA